jgi:cell wall-associated NlpC family hydrolase
MDVIMYGEVGIYLGEKQMIHSPSEEKKLLIRFNSKNKFRGDLYTCVI